MHIQFGMKIYLTIQESKGEGISRVRGMIERKASGRREQTLFWRVKVKR